nr:N-alpha-acetyltransferase 30-like [Leptinotarsa decemlineata]
MNKTHNKKSKVDKCPSVAHEKKIKDVPKNCFLSEKCLENTELKNGIANGIAEDDSLPVKRRNGKGKKCKQNNDKPVNIEDENESETIHLAKTAHEVEKKIDQSSRNKNEISKDVRTVNSVDNNKNGTKNLNSEDEKLDTNYNISCDNIPTPDLDELESVSQTQSIDNVNNDQGASSSSTLIRGSEDNTQCKEAILNITREHVAEITDSLKNVQLEDSELKSCDSLKTKHKIDFIQYESEMQMPMIMKIIQKDLSEPYSIYTYRYFIHNWPKLCFLAMCEGECVGAIVCKLDLHRKVIKRGYIAMLAVDQKYRKLRIGSNLVRMAISEMLQGNADEVVLETEVTNKPALQLYEKLGFVRDKRLFRYYLNGVDALRLKLWLR